MQKESTKSGMGCFFSTNFLVLTAHPQQRDSNTGSQISLPGSPDSLTRQKGIWTGSLQTAASASVCISQAHRERTAPSGTAPSGTAAGFQAFMNTVKTRSEAKRTSKKKQQGSPKQNKTTHTQGSPPTREGKSSSTTSLYANRNSKRKRIRRS